MPLSCTLFRKFYKLNKYHNLMKKENKRIFLIGFLIIIAFIFLFINSQITGKAVYYPAPGAGCDNANELLFAISDVSNSHVQEAGIGSYPHKVCWRGGQGNRACDGTNTILHISSSSNAHANEPGAKGNYPITICYDKLSCVARDNSCASGEEAVVSLASLTNAHVGFPDKYTKKLCCKSSGASSFTPESEPQPEPSQPLPQKSCDELFQEGYLTTPRLQDIASLISITNQSGQIYNLVDGLLLISKEELKFGIIYNNANCFPILWDFSEKLYVTNDTIKEISHQFIKEGRGAIILTLTDWKNIVLENLRIETLILGQNYKYYTNAKQSLPRIDANNPLTIRFSADKSYIIENNNGNFICYSGACPLLMSSGMSIDDPNLQRNSYNKINFIWNFGDGNTSSVIGGEGVSVIKKYSIEGRYSVSLNTAPDVGTSFTTSQDTIVINITGKEIVVVPSTNQSLAQVNNQTNETQLSDDLCQKASLKTCDDYNNFTSDDLENLCVFDPCKFGKKQLDEYKKNIVGDVEGGCEWDPEEKCSFITQEILSREDSNVVYASCKQKTTKTECIDGRRKVNIRADIDYSSCEKNPDAECRNPTSCKDDSYEENCTVTETPEDKPSRWWIIAIILALAILVVSVIIFFVWKRRKIKPIKPSLSSVPRSFPSKTIPSFPAKPISQIKPLQRAKIPAKIPPKKSDEEDVFKKLKDIGKS